MNRSQPKIAGLAIQRSKMEQECPSIHTTRNDPNCSASCGGFQKLSMPLLVYYQNKGEKTQKRIWWWIKQLRVGSWHSTLGTQLTTCAYGRSDIRFRGFVAPVPFCFVGYLLVCYLFHFVKIRVFHVIGGKAILAFDCCFYNREFDADMPAS